jgi:N-acylneuraminate cytidylyltransferase
MKSLFIIPARGGSKGIPGKNIRPFAGKPLILYSLEIARNFASDAEICISTDSSEIAQVLMLSKYTVPFLRPEELSSDNSGMYEVLLHALNHYEKNGHFFDNLVLLQPTSPFRLSEHISVALSIYSNDLDMVVSVKPAEANPYYVLFEENADGFLEKSKTGYFSRRQDCPAVWQYNGAIYIINPESLKKSNLGSFSKITKYVMDDLHSIDLDSELDWLFAEFINEKFKIIGS